MSNEYQEQQCQNDETQERRTRKCAKTSKGTACTERNVDADDNLTSKQNVPRGERDQKPGERVAAVTQDEGVKGKDLKTNTDPDASEAEGQRALDRARVE